MATMCLTRGANWAAIRPVPAPKSSTVIDSFSATCSKIAEPIAAAMPVFCSLLSQSFAFSANKSLMDGVPSFISA